MQSNKMGEFLNSLIELESHGELKKRMLTYLRARENVVGSSSGLDGVIPDPSPLNFQLGNHCATMPNPLRYINPFVATERLGYLPPAISGEAPHRPTWEEQYKTVMCESWLADGSCPYGRECRFAHGENEIRPIGFRPQPHNRRKYKTKLCEKYTKNGICPYGENCFFIHPDPNNPDDQRFFELSRRYHQISEQLVSHVRTAGRNGFSISVPVNPRAAVQALLQKESLPRLKTDTELLNGFSIEPASIGTLSDAFTAYRDFPSSILTPSSTSNSGETSPLPTLKNQVLENLRKQNDSEFMPPEEPKSTYDPFKSFDFPQSFAASFSSFNHRC